MTNSERKPHLQIILDKMTHADKVDGVKIYRVPNGIARQFLADASKLGRDRENEQKLTTSESPTEP